MAPERDYHFVRVNGNMAHNDPSKPECYVKDEPLRWPITYFDYADYCLANDVIRIGWPQVGDLSKVPVVPDRTPCYGVLPGRVRRYLANFREMEPGDGVLMPDKARPGVLFAGEVTTGYTYFHDVPRHPYECSHRVGVRWDRLKGVPVEYSAEEFGFGISGGWWLWAYYKLTAPRHQALIDRINRRRAGGR